MTSETDNISKYLEFLRFCLNDNHSVPESIKDINWHSLLEFASQQTIQGIYATTLLMQDGKMTKDDFKGNKPTDDDVMEWVFETHRLKKNNENLFKCSDKACSWFLENGFKNCILKGQGNALMYPNPFSRVSGDIDIWLDGTRDEILAFTTKYYNRRATDIHVDFPMFRDASLEVHFRPSYMLNPFTDKKLRKYFNKEKEKQFNNKVTTPDGKYTIFVPTNEFNIFYQLLHLYRHIANEGIGLRQIIDYFYLLRKCKKDGLSEESKKEFLNTLNKFGMTKFASAIMYIMKDVLGIDNDCLLMEPNEKEGMFLLKEVLLLGNFGRAETRKEALETAEGHFKRFIIYEKYNFRLLSHYPSEVIWRPIRDLKASWRNHHTKEIQESSKNT